MRLWHFHPDVVDGGYPGTWVEVLGFPEPTKDEMEGH